MLLGACSAKPTATPQPTLTPTVATVTQDTRYEIDTVQSIVRYNASGNGVFGVVQFPGTFKLKGGTVIFAAERGGARIKIDVSIDGDSVTAVNGLVLNALRSNLEVDKYPFGYFVADSRELVTEGSADFRIVASGSLELHGRRRNVEFPLRVRMEGDTLRAEGELPIDLLDYEVNVPTAIMNSRLSFTAQIVAVRQKPDGNR